MGMAAGCVLPVIISWDFLKLLGGALGIWTCIALQWYICSAHKKETAVTQLCLVLVDGGESEGDCGDEATKLGGRKSEESWSSQWEVQHLPRKNSVIYDLPAAFWSNAHWCPWVPGHCCLNYLLIWTEMFGEGSWAYNLIVVEFTIKRKRWSFAKQFWDIWYMTNLQKVSSW